jgi:hypothetical protein
VRFSARGAAFVISVSARRGSQEGDLFLGVAVWREFNVLASGLVRLGLQILKEGVKAMVTRSKWGGGELK